MKNKINISICLSISEKNEKNQAIYLSVEKNKISQNNQFFYLSISIYLILTIYLFIYLFSFINLFEKLSVKYS